MTAGLTALLLALPATAYATTCFATGEAHESAWDVLLRLSSKPVALALFALAGFALYKRERVPFAIAGVLWGVLALLIAVDNHELFFDDKRALGIIEDCAASPHLFIGLAIAICAGMTYGALRPRN
ncbi:hypothetical protein [Leisingera sp. ANG59]|uniref:hypothetical protein n=1 Tax=Leisingera sp. ANG59 TaxID=2675221 RepID=UPI001572638C|nr:hypothetical protein [Leisingera sp. ANG59]